MSFKCSDFLFSMTYSCWPTFQWPTFRWPTSLLSYFRCTVWAWTVPARQSWWWWVPPRTSPWGGSWYRTHSWTCCTLTRTPSLPQYEPCTFCFLPPKHGKSLLKHLLFFGCGSKFNKVFYVDMYLVLKTIIISSVRDNALHFFLSMVNGNDFFIN